MGDGDMHCSFNLSFGIQNVFEEILISSKFSLSFNVTELFVTSILSTKVLTIFLSPTKSLLLLIFLKLSIKRMILSFVMRKDLG